MCMNVCALRYRKNFVERADVVHYLAGRSRLSGNEQQRYHKHNCILQIYRDYFKITAKLVHRLSF